MAFPTNRRDPSSDVRLGDRLEVAGGSVIGYEHQRRGRNNQDAWAWRHTPNMWIGVVADGCGSCPHSEVGAQLGVRLLINTVQEWVDDDGTQNWPKIQSELLDTLATMALSMGTDLGQIIEDYFLFTLVGAILTPEETTLFWLGDGVIAINGEVQILPACPGNAPPYLGYGIGATAFLPWHVERLPTRNVGSLLIGTDGVLDLLAATDRCLPGQNETEGSLSQFWTDDRYFHNPDQIRRRLALLNRQKAGWRRRLPDDTTLIVLRQREIP